MSSLLAPHEHGKIWTILTSRQCVYQWLKHTRYTHRFVPVSATCYADLSDMQTLCKSVLQSYLAKYDETFSHTVSPIMMKDCKVLTLYQYKIELRMRNHTNLTRSAVIEAIAECVPERCKVNLTNPELFLLVEIFKVSFVIQQHRGHTISPSLSRAFAACQLPQIIMLCINTTSRNLPMTTLKKMTKVVEFLGCEGTEAAS